MNSNLVRLVCYAVAMGMGLAVIVTSILAPLSAGTAAGMLAIGVAVLGFAGLQKA